MTTEQAQKLALLRARFDDVRLILEEEAIQQCGLRTLSNEIDNLKKGRDKEICDLKHMLAVHEYNFSHTSMGSLPGRFVAGIGGATAVYTDESSLTQGSIDRLIQAETWIWDKRIFELLQERNVVEMRIDFTRYNRFHALTRGIGDLEAESDIAFVDELIALLEAKDRVLAEN